MPPRLSHPRWQRGRAPDATFIDRLGENLSERRDLCGPRADARPEGTWEERATVLSPGAPQPVSNGMDLRLTNLDSVELDLSRMNLSDAEALTLNVTGDGTSTLILAAPWDNARRVLTRDGVRQGTRRAQNEVMILTEDFSGEHVWVLSPRRRGRS